MDHYVIPHFNTNARLLEVSAARKPSKTTLKYVHAQIRLKNRSEDHVFVPGDIIEGEFVLFKTKEGKVIKDIYFNAVEIKFENKFQTVLGQEALFFSMEDNPTVESLPKFATNPDKYPFESCSFPFVFTIPHQHLEDTCVGNHDLHRSLVPSYGCPQLCGESFHATEVAGLRPTQTVSMMKLKALTWKKFCNFYSITCRVKQNIKDQERPYVVFTRSLEIKVKNEFEPLPTNIFQTHLDIGSYYGIPDVNASNELCITKSINLKHGEELTGSITVSSLLPPPISMEGTTSFPLDLKYIPNSTQSLPVIKCQVELLQYTVQSSSCIPPNALYSNLPASGPVEFSIFKEQGCTRLIQRIQSAFTETSILNREEWIPDYMDSKAYVKQAEITLPSLVKDEVLQSTFHSCHIQNIYCLDVKLTFEQDLKSNIVESPKKPTFGSLLRLKKENPPPASTTTSYAVANSLSLTIPIIVI